MGETTELTATPDLGSATTETTSESTAVTEATTSESTAVTEATTSESTAVTEATTSESTAVTEATPGTDSEVTAVAEATVEADVGTDSELLTTDPELTRWSTTFRTGLAWQDEQHQELLDVIGQLYEAISEGREMGQIEKTIEFLDDYVKTHFGMEENYMKSYEYPCTLRHIQEHEWFIAELSIYRSAFELTPTNVTAMSLCYDLNEWFVTHIKTSDKELGVFLRDKMSGEPR